jgi:hypothetical protein
MNGDHSSVRRTLRLRLGVLTVGAAAPLGLLVVPISSGAAKAADTVALSFKVTGSGTVWTGKHAITCRVASCTHTFHVGRWQRIVVNASPQEGWKLTKWAGACKGSSKTCSLRLRRRRSAAVAFVPPGSHLNPYPIGAAATLTGSSGNWQVKVDSAILDANAQADPFNPPPRAGWQYALVTLTMTYGGSGSSAPTSLLDSPSQMWAEGRAYTIYPPDGCQPPQPDLGSAGRLSAGESTTGNLCYEIRSKDASTLLLSGQALKGKTRRTVWFALR